MINYLKRLAIISISLWFFLEASGALALTISPPVKEISGEPGTIIEGTIKLYNESREEIAFSPSAANFKAKENGTGEPDFSDSNDDLVEDLASWIKFSSNDVTIKPLEWQEVSFEINIPSNAEPGGHYAAVFFSPVKKEEGKSNVNVNYKTGSLILLTVGGNVKQSARILGMTLKNSWAFFEYLPVEMEVRIENNGNVHFRPGGKVNIYNTLGRKVADIPIITTDSGGNVLPQSVRRFDLVWNSAHEKPKGFWEKVKLEWNDFHLGRYRAVTDVGLPEGQSAPMSIAFWIIPWQLISVVLVIVVILVAFFRIYSNWIIKKTKEKIEKTESERKIIKNSEDEIAEFTRKS